MTRCFAEKASRSISDKSFCMLENAQKPALLFFSRALRGYVLVLTHWPGPDTTVLPRLITGLMLIVRLFIQACALPVGFACFLKEKTLLICAHLLCEACDTIASFAWVTRITSSNLPQRSSRARAGAPMRPPREEVLHRSPGWRKELSRWRTGTLNPCRRVSERCHLKLTQRMQYTHV